MSAPRQLTARRVSPRGKSLIMLVDLLFEDKGCIVFPIKIVIMIPIDILIHSYYNDAGN